MTEIQTKLILLLIKTILCDEEKKVRRISLSEFGVGASQTGRTDGAAQSILNQAGLYRSSRVEPREMLSSL